MAPRKIFGLLALFCALFTVSTIGGHYLGAWVFLKLAHIHEAPNWHTLADYRAIYGRYPAVAQLIRIGQIVSIAVSLLPVVLLGLVLYALRRKFALYGEARFASDTELEQAGFFRKAGAYPDILLGRMASGSHKGDLIRFQGQQFVSLSAPTRSGKGVGIVIPNLLHYRDSAVVLDIKLENFLKTAGFRRYAGQEVFLFAPDGYAQTHEDEQAGTLRSHRWNPLSYIRRNPLYRTGDVLKIATILYPTTGTENDLWSELARALFKGLVLYLLDKEPSGETVVLARVLELTAPVQGLSKWMKAILSAPAQALSDECIAEFNRFCAAPERTQGSILSNLVAPLAIFGNAACAAATSGDDFDLREVRRKRMSIYFCLAPNNIGAYARLTNLFFSQLINENTHTLPEQDAALKYQCLVILDEFAALGRMDIVKQAIGYAAGYNLRFMFIFQSNAQLEDKTLYGPEGAKTLLDMCAVKIVFPPKEVNDEAKSYSETLGYNTVDASSSSKSRGQQTSRSTSTHAEKRALMLPQEIVALGQESRHGIPVNALILMERLRPFLAKKILYFDEADFVKRCELAKEYQPEIPLLKHKPALLSPALRSTEVEHAHETQHPHAA